MAKTYRPLSVPAGVTVEVQAGRVLVKGKSGTISVSVRVGLAVRVSDGQVTVSGTEGIARAHLGSLRAHLGNALVGVTQGYQKVLELRGMGYKAQKTKDGVQLVCGYSHPVSFAVPPGVSIDVGQAPDPDDSKLQMFEITVRGCDRHAVGQMAADIRRVHPPDVYHGKGIRYKGQPLRKKQGKRAAGAQQA